MAAKNIGRFVRGDEFGNDPLRHSILTKLDRVSRFKLHTVRPEEEGNPAIIAFDYYSNPDFDFIILAYNGIADGMSLRSGQTIKIPNSSQIESLTTTTKRARNIRI